MKFTKEPKGGKEMARRRIAVLKAASCYFDDAVSSQSKPVVSHLRAPHDANGLIL